MVKRGPQCVQLVNVAVAAVAGREHIARAFAAGRRVRRDRGSDMPRFALMNGEGRIALQRNFSAQNRIDSRERRFGGTECRFKPQYSFSLPLDFDPDTGRIIKDEAGQMAFKRYPVNGGPETNPVQDRLRGQAVGSSAVFLA